MSKSEEIMDDEKSEYYEQNIREGYVNLRRNRKDNFYFELISKFEKNTKKIFAKFNKVYSNGMFSYSIYLTSFSDEFDEYLVFSEYENGPGFFEVYFYYGKTNFIREFADLIYSYNLHETHYIGEKLVKTKFNFTKVERSMIKEVKRGFIDRLDNFHFHDIVFNL